VVALIAAAILIAGVYALFSTAQRQQQRLDASNHLRGILMELHVFNDNYGRIPHAIERDEDGGVTHSWRFIACRMLFGDRVQCGFYGQDATSAYEQSWDSPGNRCYFDGPHRDYGGSPHSFIDPTRPGNLTRFVAITGRDTAFDGQLDINLTEIPPHTIIITEVRNSGQHWMEPGGDLDMNAMPRTVGNERGPGVSGQDASGFWVGFANGEVWLISYEVPFELLSKFFTLSGAAESSRSELLGRYRIL